jgi:hypothetical protein
MANHSFLSIWLNSLPEDQILDRFGALLATAPASATKPGFTRLTIRAVDSSETPVLEQDLRATPLDAYEIVELAGEYLHADSAYEVVGAWDLSLFDASSGKSSVEPPPLQIVCRGEEFDGEFWRENGHFEIDLGFEHFFTGHAGLLGLHAGPRPAPQSPEESRFLEAMAWPENLEKYQKQTRENIRTLFDWVARIEAALPVEKTRLWSEGEENFEARLDDIVAAR